MTQSNFKLHIRCFFLCEPCWTESCLKRMTLSASKGWFNILANSAISATPTLMWVGELAWIISACCFIIQGSGIHLTERKERKLLNLGDFMILSGFCLRELIGYQHRPLNIQQIIILKAYKPAMEWQSVTHFTPKICYHTSNFLLCGCLRHVMLNSAWCAHISLRAPGRSCRRTEHELIESRGEHDCDIDRMCALFLIMLNVFLQ